MEFEEVLEQTIALLQRQGRISYGALAIPRHMRMTPNERYVPVWVWLRL
jgi:hypothetical protein